MHRAMRLKIKCSGKRPSVSELLAIRKLLEQHRQGPPAELRSVIKDTGELDLGNIAPARATEIVNRANDLGLHIIATDVSVTNYLPINRATKDAMPVPPCNATHTSVTDVVPNLTPGPQINLIVNIADVFSIIQGFQGLEYPGTDLTDCE